jgi:CRP/FNR family transcriptional regulator, nitrogen oxide reductase regulator
VTDSATLVPSGLSSVLFLGIPEDALQVIVAAAQSKVFPAKQRMLTAGEPACHLFLLQSGRAKYYRVTPAGAEILLHLLSPGDPFGLGTFLKHPPPYLGSAETVSKCEVLVWEHATIKKLALTYPALAENALRVVLNYLKEFADRHSGLVAQTAEQRLMAALVKLGHRTGQILPAGVQVDVTNEQLAALADVSLFTASRVLSALERKGHVVKHRGKVVIHAPENLVAD